MKNEEVEPTSKDIDLIVKAAAECAKANGTKVYRVAKVVALPQNKAKVHTLQWNPETLQDEPGCVGCIRKPAGMPVKGWRNWMSASHDRVVVVTENITKGYSEMPLTTRHAGYADGEDYLLLNAKRKFVATGACTYRTKRQCTSKEISSGVVALRQLEGKQGEACEQEEGAYVDWGLEPFFSVKLGIAHAVSSLLTNSAKLISCHSDAQVWQWAKDISAAAKQSEIVCVHPYGNRKAFDAFAGVTSVTLGDLSKKHSQCSFVDEVLSAGETCLAVLGVHMLDYEGSSILAGLVSTWSAELRGRANTAKPPTLCFVGVLPALSKTSWQVTLPAADWLWSRITDFKECCCVPCAPTDPVHNLMALHESGKVASLLQSKLVDSEIGTLTDLHELTVRGKPWVLCLPPHSKTWALKSLSQKTQSATTDLVNICGPCECKIVLLLNSRIPALDVITTVGRLSMDPTNPVKIIERVPGLIYDQDPTEARQRDAAYAENLAYIV